MPVEAISDAFSFGRGPYSALSPTRPQVGGVEGVLGLELAPADQALLVKAIIFDSGQDRAAGLCLVSAVSEATACGQRLDIFEHVGDRTSGQPETEEREDVL